MLWVPHSISATRCAEGGCDRDFCKRGSTDSMVPKKDLMDSCTQLCMLQELNMSLHGGAWHVR